LKAQGKEGDFSVTVCVTTLYSYIDKGIFLKLSNKNLPVKKNKKRNYKKVQRQQKRAAAGESIDKRPKEIDTREEFGNWEMDSVLGKRGKSKNTLLVLTERKTRNEIIFKLPDHTDEAVVAALDRLERKWGADMFKRVFKTITVDNGSEFADVEGLQRSIINEGESGQRYITATRTAVGSVAQMR
jgi:IS30 family transposase